MKYDYGLKPLIFWCQKVLPLIYDESLSYEELLCKVVAYLNNCIEAINGLPEYIQSLLTDEHLKEIFSEVVDELREQIARANEGTNTTASYNRNKDELVWLNGKLAVMTRNILAGDRYVEEVDPDDDITGNFVYTSIEIELNKVKDALATAVSGLNSAIDEETTARRNADRQLDDSIIEEATAREHADRQLGIDISTETTAREDADIQLTNAVSKLNLFELPINHGAIGDGFTDDTQAIQNTIDAASSSGKTVLLNGNYSVSKITIPSGIKITGAFTQANRENLIVSDCIEISYGQIPTAISNLYIKGTNASDYLIKVYAESVTITNCSINASGGCVLNYGSLNKFIGNSITCNGDFAFKLDISEHLNINTIITNNIIAGTGSLLTCTSNNPAIRPEGILFANNNSMCTGGYCIHLEAAYHISILNNTLDQIGRHALTFNPTQGIESVIFSDNYIGITDPDFFAIGGLLPQNSPIIHNMIISNNNFFGCSCMAYLNGYYQSVIIDGNNFESNSASGYPGLYCENTAYLRVTNNRIFKSVAGATAVALDGLNIGHLILSNNIFLGAKTVTNYDVNHLTDSGNLSV